MTPEQQQAIQTHVEAISAILYADCEPESLKTLEDIELAVKERVLTHQYFGQFWNRDAPRTETKNPWNFNRNSQKKALFRLSSKNRRT
jgi:hypothetical protein